MARHVVRDDKNKFAIEMVMLTLRSSFSINSPSCVLNLEPTEMKVNFPLDAIELFVPKITFTSGLADS